MRKPSISPAPSKHFSPLPHVNAPCYSCQCPDGSSVTDCLKVGLLIVIAQGGTGISDVLCLGIVCVVVKRTQSLKSN